MLRYAECAPLALRLGDVAAWPADRPHQEEATVIASPTQQLRVTRSYDTYAREPRSPQITQARILAPELMLQISTHSSGRVPTASCGSGSSAIAPRWLRFASVTRIS